MAPKGNAKTGTEMIYGYVVRFRTRKITSWPTGEKNGPTYSLRIPADETMGGGSKSASASQSASFKTFEISLLKPMAFCGMTTGLPVSASIVFRASLRPLCRRAALRRLFRQNADNVHDGKKPFLPFLVPNHANALVFKQLNAIVHGTFPRR
jgi:hypothetical protein